MYKHLKPWHSAETFPHKTCMFSQLVWFLLCDAMTYQACWFKKGVSMFFFHYKTCYFLDHVPRPCGMWNRFKAYAVFDFKPWQFDLIVSAQFCSQTALLRIAHCTFGQTLFKANRSNNQTIPLMCNCSGQHWSSALHKSRLQSQSGFPTDNHAWSGACAMNFDWPHLYWTLTINGHGFDLQQQHYDCSLPLFAQQWPSCWICGWEVSTF